MKNLSIKKLIIFGAVFMIIAGSLLHFTYAWSGNNGLVGVLSAINESVWEHSKLFILPIILVGLVEYLRLREGSKVAWSKLVEFVFMSLFITAFFYTYTGALGVEENLTIDIASFIIAIIIGRYISYKILVSKKPSAITGYLSLAGLAFLFGLFTYFSFYAPDYPLFQPHDHSAAERH